MSRQVVHAAQNVGIFGVAGYIALAGLCGSPISVVSTNAARTLFPDLIAFHLTI